MELPIDVIDKPGLINTVSYEHLRSCKGEVGDTVLAICFIERADPSTFGSGVLVIS